MKYFHQKKFHAWVMLMEIGKNYYRGALKRTRKSGIRDSKYPLIFFFVKPDKQQGMEAVRRLQKKIRNGSQFVFKCVVK